MENRYKQRIEQIRQKMAACGLDMYYIPMDDCHNSEYVGAHFKVIEFVTGFTGSAASVLITKTQAFLWTDGRYFLQASMELEGSGVELMKTGQEGVPKIADFIQERLSRNEVLGFEGRVVSTAFARNLTGQLRYDLDLAGDIWTDRPAQRFSKIRLFSESSGESTESKLSRLRDSIPEENGVYIINALDDIAWLFNIRAHDISYNPVAYSYAAVTKTGADIFLGAGAVGQEAQAYFDSLSVGVKSYEQLQKDILTVLPEGLKDPVILLDPERISFDMYRFLLDKGYQVKDFTNPTSAMKAVKNPTEIANTKKAQVKDGVALVKFIKWIKENAGKMPITECDAADKLKELRAEQEGFIEPSFETIAGYGSNAAIIHYEPVRGKDASIQAEGMLLVDSGGHYLEGTTDTTRTIVLGPVTEEEKKCFTLVAASMLRLLNFDSRKATTAFNGLECDKLARALLIEHGYNYNHGTGHGIGYVLNVHENPPVISGSRAADMAKEEFLPGMISSDEPGIYVDGSFGIRTENDMLVVEKEDAQGCFLAFENLTCVPIDLDGIDRRFLSDEDAALLNAFHRQVYETLAPLLDEETKHWLAQYTQSV